MMIATDKQNEETLRARRDVLLAKRAVVPYDERSEHVLGQLSSTWRSLALELRSVLRKTPSKVGTMNAQTLSPASRKLLLEAVLYTSRARAEIGFDTPSIADLGTPSTILAIENRMGEEGGVCSLQAASGSMWLKEVRKLVRFVHGECDPLIGKKQREFAAQPKLSKDHRVFFPEEYLAGAMAISAFAEVLIEAGYARGRILSRNAALLAANSRIHGRRGELHRANCGDFRSRTVAGQPALAIVLRVTKTQHDKSVTISDPRVLGLVAPLVLDDPTAPLFRNEYGERLSESGVAHVLVWTADLAVGERGGANIMRCSAGKRSNGRKKAVAVLLGQITEDTANKNYSPDQAPLGLSLIVSAANETANARRFSIP